MKFPFSLLLLMGCLFGSLVAEMRVSYSDQLKLDLSSFPSKQGCDIWLSKNSSSTWVLVGKTFKDEKSYIYQAKEKGIHAFHIHPRQNDKDDYQPSTGAPIHASILLKALERNNTNILYSNKRSLSISYEVQDMTQGNFESWLYYTTTSGITWSLYGPDGDGKSPIPFSIDRDGLFGFKVISSDIAGQKETAPTPGITPDILVRIDTIAPEVNIISPQPYDLWEEGSTRSISWESRDEAMERLASVALYYSLGQLGNWQLIAEELPSSGSMDWKIPGSKNGRLFIQARAKDKSGNTGRSKSELPFFNRNVLEEMLSKDVRDRADGFYETATICRKNRQFAKAVKYFRLCLQLNPYHVKAFNDSGITLLKMGLNREAFDQFEGGLKYAPSQPQLLFNVARLYTEHLQFPEAQSLLKRLLHLYPKDSDGLWLLADVNDKLGQVEKARELWKRIVDLEFAPESRGPRHQIMAKTKLSKTLVGPSQSTLGSWFSK